MKQITKEALYERGFMRGRNYFERSLKGGSIEVHGDKMLVYFEDHLVPNCKTLQDLDNLIYLFK